MLILKCLLDFFFFLIYFSVRTAPIHAEAPEFTDMSVEQEILVTGIKVVDLLAPYAKGGKIGMSQSLTVCTDNDGADFNCSVVL